MQESYEAESLHLHDASATDPHASAEQAQIEGDNGAWPEGHQKRPGWRNRDFEGPVAYGKARQLITAQTTGSIPAGSTRPQAKENPRR